MIKFAFWPDGDFCEISAVGDFTWKSDDYEVLEFKTVEEAEVHSSQKRTLFKPVLMSEVQILLGIVSKELQVKPHLKLCPEATPQKEFFGEVNVNGAKIKRFRSLDQGSPF